jgi:hypothetical protein
MYGNVRGLLHYGEVIKGHKHEQNKDALDFLPAFTVP